MENKIESSRVFHFTSVSQHQTIQLNHMQKIIKHHSRKITNIFPYPQQFSSAGRPLA
jgi:hypothetical protein